MDQGAIWGEKIGIRPLKASDASTLKRYYQDPEVAELLFEEGGDDLPPTWLLALSIAVGRLDRRSQWAIVQRDGRMVGMVKLWRISERNGSAMLTIFIGEKSCWNRGYGTDALRLVLRQAFRALNLRRVELHVFDFNQRAIRSYEKAGFVREGVRREALYARGKRHDIYVMGVLQEEFMAREGEREAAMALRLIQPR